MGRRNWLRPKAVLIYLNRIVKSNIGMDLPVKISNRDATSMKTIYSLTTALLMLLAFSSCTPKMTFLDSSIVPSATGSVNVKRDRNNNYAIQIRIANLAEPKKLDPPKNTYIVWMESGRESAKKIGQITTSTGLFSKALKAELNATETEKPDRIFITAEDDAGIQYPDGPTILTTKR
jgi:hypothetical protein